MTTERFGKELIDNAEHHAIYPRNIWKQGSNTGIKYEIAETARLGFEGRLRTIPKDECIRETLECIQLKNVDIQTNTIKKYRMSLQQQEKMLKDLMMDVWEDTELGRLRNNYERTPFSQDQNGIIMRTGIEEQISTAVLRLCWKNVASFIVHRHESYQDIGKYLDEEMLRGKMEQLNYVESLCGTMKIESIVKRSSYGDYGNCILCYGKGRRNTKCNRRYDCSNSMYGGIMIFKNLDGYYINPDLLDIVLGGLNGKVSEEGKRVEESVSYEICLPINYNEYMETTFLCEYKLLWYAQMYDESSTDLLKHVMNEVVTTFDVMNEMYKVYKVLLIRERNNRSLLWFWDWRHNMWDRSESDNRTDIYGRMKIFGIEEMVRMLKMMNLAKKEEAEDSKEGSNSMVENEGNREKRENVRNREDVNERERRVRSKME